MEKEDRFGKTRRGAIHISEGDPWLHNSKFVVLTPIAGIDSPEVGRKLEKLGNPYGVDRENRRLISVTESSPADFRCA